MKSLQNILNESAKTDAEKAFDYVEKAYRGYFRMPNKTDKHIEKDNVQAVIKLFDELVYYTRDMFSSDEQDELFVSELKKISEKSIEDFDY